MIDNIQSLWRAVILQAVIDACSRSKKKVNKIERKKAQSWLLDMSDDFISVCNMANYNPHYVRRKAKEIMIQKGLKPNEST